MAFGSEFGCVSAAPKYVSVVKGGVAFLACWCGALFSAAHVYVDSPRHLISRAYDVCRFRERYGLCSQFGSIWM